VFPRKAMLNHNSILGRHYDRWSPRAQSSRLSSAASIKYRGIYRSDKRRLISNATSKPFNTNSYAADSLPINNKAMHTESHAETNITLAEGKDCENNSAKSCVVYNPSMTISYCSCTGENQPCYRWEMEVGSQQ
jgi:hypothetical protein